MRKVLGVVVLVSTLMIPTQIMLSSPQVVFAGSRAGEEPDTYSFQVMGRTRALQMQMEKLEHMLMENRGKMTKAKMEKMEKMISRIQKEIEELLEMASRAGD